MVVISQPIRFDEEDPRAMLRHLDDWARRGLGSAEAWGSTVELCGQWGDYSARNQVLLASYGIGSVVAGTATWQRVEGVDGRPCAVRAGEHGLPVRVPELVGAEVAAERTRSTGPSAVAGSHRWELVFAEEQLARRPGPNALSSPSVPRMNERQWAEAVRVASGRMTGRMPRKIDDPQTQLAVLAARVPLGAGRVKLSDEQRAQAAWLVTDRLGRARGPLPTFDPSALPVRERWRSLVDTREATGRLLSAVSYAIGVDLAASPLPRHELVDDRAVPPARRNYLAPSDVRSLALGVWTEVGPYTKAEWMGRGVAGAEGRAAFLRVNERSYLAGYETRAGAMWRLETTGRGAHHGLVAEGTASSLGDAKDRAAAALRERFPDVARAVESSNTVLSLTSSWAPLSSSADQRTQIRPLDDRVAAMVTAGPGGRWQTWTLVDGKPQQGPLAPTADDARAVAEALARGVMMQASAQSPDRANRMVNDLATSATGWRRDDLVQLIGHRLTNSDRDELSRTRSPERLVELMAAVGVLTPPTMMRVLWAEGVGADTAASVVPALGIDRTSAVRMLHDEWGVDRLRAGAALGASTDELRDAGCSAREMLVAAPREELRRLDTRESTWVQAGAALLDAGYERQAAVDELAMNAPSPSTFAAAVQAIIPDPVEGLALALANAALPDLASLSERYGLSPQETAHALAAACADTETAVAVLDARCEGDIDVVTQLAVSVLAIDTDTVRAALDPATPSSVVVDLAAYRADDDLAIVDL
jgi:hypothetical protein